jgi:acyl-CoA dehydrogenase
MHAKWAVSYCFYHAQKSMIAFCHNFPVRSLGLVIRLLAFPWGQSMRYPSDKLEHQLSQLMTQNNHYRANILNSVYLSGDATQPVDKMEHALQLILSHADLYKKISDLRRYKFGELQGKLAEKVASGGLTQQEMDILVSVEKARWDAMQVDEFTFESMKKKTFTSVTEGAKTPMY